MEAADAIPGERRPGPGRPPTGARERILEGCLEVLKESGYAGLSIAKVAVASGESKALVSYHFGSRAGLVTETARGLGRAITERVVEGIEGARTVAEIVRGSLNGAWEMVDEDERLPRVYFDLNAVSVVDTEVREVMREVKTGFRRVLTDQLAEAEPPVERKLAANVAVLVIAGIEGLLLERIERGESAELGRARDLFVRSIVAVV